MNRSHPSTRPILRVPVLVFAPLALALLACCPSVEPLQGLLSGQEEATETAPAPGCTVPDLIAMDAEAAQRKLSDLGLTPLVTEQHHDLIPAGVVISSSPLPGTSLDPCQGQVTLRVSIGPAAPAPEPTATTAPSGISEEMPPESDYPLFFTTAFEETFETGFAGFRPEWGVDTDPAYAYTNEYGQLVTEGYVAAFVGDSSWFNYRITFGGADYSRVDQFFVLARTQDNENFVGMDCFPSEGWLACEGRKVIDGQAGPVTGFQMTTRMCTLDQIQCDIAFEARGNEYSVFVNGEQKAGFTDDTFTQGGVGFVVDGEWVLDYFEALDPGGPASYPFTLFRDDFDLNAWSTGDTEDEYAVGSQSIVDGKYRWEVEALQGVAFQEIHEVSMPFDLETYPHHFSLSARAEVVSGPADAAYGLLFRAVDYDNLYYFRVTNDGEAGLYAAEEGEWVELIAPTVTPLLQPGQENLLRVVAEGSRFSLWINGDYLFQINDSLHKTGDIGLAVELMDAGDQAVIDFDDVQIGIP